MHPVKCSNNFSQATSVLEQYQETDAIRTVETPGLFHSHNILHTLYTLYNLHVWNK